MSTIEVIMLLVGVAFILASFFVGEKLSQKDIDRIAGMSEDELKVIVERQLKHAESRVEDSIEDTISEAVGVTKRAMEHETNEKIMAINEYSDTVMEAMNKTHQEIVFLYNMLNDKHVELTDLAEQLHEFSRQVKNTESEVLSSVAEAAKELEISVQKVPVMREEELVQAAERRVELAEPEDEKEEGGNYNEQILALHAEGISDVEIARQLGCGLGEVKLVIGLYRGG